jgi:hypothetical protein
MAKKSNKTSHVLNLLTNRTGLSADDLETNALPKERQPRKHTETPVLPADDEAEPDLAVFVKPVHNVSELIRINLEKIERKERIGG